jgi:hypothetical protein
MQQADEIDRFMRGWRLPGGSGVAVRKDLNPLAAFYELARLKGAPSERVLR